MGFNLGFKGLNGNRDFIPIYYQVCELLELNLPSPVRLAWRTQVREKKCILLAMIIVAFDATQCELLAASLINRKFGLNTGYHVVFVFYFIVTINSSYLV
jgi:hypothetical protein